MWFLQGIQWWLIFFKKFYKIKIIIIVAKCDPVKIEMGVLWRKPNISILKFTWLKDFVRIGNFEKEE